MSVSFPPSEPGRLSIVMDESEFLFPLSECSVRYEDTSPEFFNDIPEFQYLPIPSVQSLILELKYVDSSDGKIKYMRVKATMPRI